MWRIPECMSRFGTTYKACTLEFLTRRHHNQHMPLMTMVENMMAMAGIPLHNKRRQFQRKQSSRHPALVTFLGTLKKDSYFGTYRLITSWSPLIKRVMASSATWQKAVHMMMEKTSTPMGSSLLRPTGYRY